MDSTAWLHQSLSAAWTSQGWNADFVIQDVNFKNESHCTIVFPVKVLQNFGPNGSHYFWFTLRLVKNIPWYCTPSLSLRYLPEDKKQYVITQDEKEEEGRQPTCHCVGSLWQPHCEGTPASGHGSVQGKPFQKLEMEQGHQNESDQTQNPHYSLSHFQFLWEWKRWWYGHFHSRTILS